MREFTATELVSRPSEVLEAAGSGAVGITKYGRREFVILSALEYRQLTRKQASRAKPAPAEPQEARKLPRIRKTEL